MGQNEDQCVYHLKWKSKNNLTYTKNSCVSTPTKNNGSSWPQQLDIQRLLTPFLGYYPTWKYSGNTILKYVVCSSSQDSLVLRLSQRLVLNNSYLRLPLPRLSLDPYPPDTKWLKNNPFIFFFFGRFSIFFTFFF